MHSTPTRLRYKGGYGEQSKVRARAIDKPPARVMTLWRAVWNAIETGRFDEALAAASKLPSRKEVFEARALIEARRSPVAAVNFIEPAPAATAQALAPAPQCLTKTARHLEVLVAIVNAVSNERTEEAHALFAGLHRFDQGVILATLVSFNPRYVGECGYPEELTEAVRGRRAAFWTDVALRLYNLSHKRLLR